MDLKEFLHAARKSWWLVVILAVVGLAAGVGLTARKPATYASSVTFFVSTPVTSTSGTAFQADQYAQQRVNSYVKLIRSDKVAQAVATDQKLTLSATHIAKKITASAPLNTVLLTATVTDTSPTRARSISTGLADTFPTLVSTLDNASATEATVKLDVVSGPTNPTKVGPRKKLNYAIGLLIGLLIGLAVAALRQLLNTSIRDTEVLDELTGRPTLGLIGFDPAAKKNALIIGGESRSVRAESFRQLRTNLRFMDVDHPLRVVQISSSVAGEGKSTTAANVALVFAEAETNVLLIEADLRRPRVVEFFGLDRAVGLTDVLAGQVKLDDALQQWGQSTLTVLASGSLPPNPSELLGTANMKELITTLRGRFDMVIIDSPPLLPVTDAAVVSAMADGVVVVVRHGKTTRAQLATAVGSLEAVDARVLGFVLNMQPTQRSSRKGYDGYGYYEDAQVGNPAATSAVAAQPAAGKPAAAEDGRTRQAE